jgi:hypothetical protein
MVAGGTGDASVVPPEMLRAARSGFIEVDERVEVHRLPVRPGRGLGIVTIRLGRLFGVAMGDEA